MIDMCLYAIWEFNICYVGFLLFLGHTAWKYTFCFPATGWGTHISIKGLQLMGPQACILKQTLQILPFLLALPSVLIQFQQSTLRNSNHSASPFK